jgi:hypothetical protein
MGRDRCSGRCVIFTRSHASDRSHQHQARRRPRHRLTPDEVVASNVEMLSGRRKKDYAAETAAQALATQAEAMGLDPVGPEDYEAAEVDTEAIDGAGTDTDTDEAEATEPVAA